MNAADGAAAIVLAAGQGKRFRSELPKVLHEAAGRPLIHYVLRTVSEANLERVLVVVGHGRARVADAVTQILPRAEIVVQEEALGTAHAVSVCGEALVAHMGPVVVLHGDGPLVRPETIERLLVRHAEARAKVSLVTAELDDPTGYGRIVRDGSDRVSAIVEEADASPELRKIREISAGIWCFERAALFDAITQVTQDNEQGEYYLPEAAMVIARQTGDIYTLMIEDPTEAEGVNDRNQLALATQRIRLRRIEELAKAGVTFIDPSATYVDDTVQIGAGTTILPNSYLEGETKIGKGCTIGPSTRLIDTTVEDGAEVTFTVGHKASIGARSKVGPFAYLRPGATLHEGAKIGTFVEINRSQIGKGSKVPHLSYVGDSEVGDDVNIGAGTITGNYDGETGIKSKTVVEDGVDTGSGTTIVAPVTIGREAVTGAGAVVTKDVAPGDVVVGIPARPVRKRKPPPRDNRH